MLLNGTRALDRFRQARYTFSIPVEWYILFGRVSTNFDWQLKNGWHSRCKDHRPCHDPTSGFARYGAGRYCTIETLSGHLRTNPALWGQACRGGRSVSLPFRGKKGNSPMGSSGAIPWYNVPARQFPALVWLERRYPFRISPLVFARSRPSLARLGQTNRRRFPAQVWAEAQ